MISFAFFDPIEIVLYLLLFSLSGVSLVLSLSCQPLDSILTSLDWFFALLLIALPFSFNKLPLTLLLALSSIKSSYSFFLCISEDHVGIVKTSFRVINILFLHTIPSQTVSHQLSLSFFFLKSFLFVLLLLVFEPIFEFDSLLSLHFLSLLVGFSSLLGLFLLKCVLFSLSLQSSQSIFKSELSIFLVFSIF